PWRTDVRLGTPFHLRERLGVNSLRVWWLVRGSCRVTDQLQDQADSFPDTASVQRRERPLWLLLGLNLALLTVLVSALWLAVWMMRRSETPRPAPSAGDFLAAQALTVGTPAPNFRLPLLDGGEMDLSTLRGRPVLVNFWASWCAPCRAEMPALEQIARDYGQAGLVVVGVNQLEDPDTVRQFVQELGISFPIGLDRDGRVSRDWRVYGIPQTYLIDADGVIRKVWVGPVTEDSVSRALVELGLQSSTPFQPIPTKEISGEPKFA
ncbi:MAG: TlpA family protein disulfide reductase, partial [Thermomicrobium sp.]